MAHTEKLSIAIVGGGLAGLTLSIGLTRHGIPHKIYESASKFAEIGAGIALGPNSITALELIDPSIGEGLKKCITYNEGIDEEGKGDHKEEFLDVRVGEENGEARLLHDCSLYCISESWVLHFFLLEVQVLGR
jgi:2-polyprenyl-6-methoxyphenol hydroxylase-like FAD-dependent oxidoreductase